MAEIAACNFCGEKREVVWGPLVCICGACVKLCGDLLAERAALRGESVPSPVASLRSQLHAAQEELRVLREVARRVTEHYGKNTKRNEPELFAACHALWCVLTAPSDKPRSALRPVILSDGMNAVVTAEPDAKHPATARVACEDGSLRDWPVRDMRDAPEPSATEPASEQRTDPTDTLRSQLRAANEALRVLREAASGCSDGHCVLRPENRRGAHTNGGCTCLKKLRRVLAAPAPQSVEAPAPAAPPQTEALRCTCPDAGLPMLGHSPDCPIGLAEARLRAAPPADRAEPKRDAAERDADDRDHYCATDMLSGLRDNGHGVNADDYALLMNLLAKHGSVGTEPKRDASEPGSAAASDAEKRDVVAYEEHRIGSLPPYYARCGDMELTATWVVSPALGKAICDEMTARMRGTAAERDGKDGGR